MNHEVMRYERALKKQLRCTLSTKKRLLQQFRVSLDTYLEDNPAPSKADLLNAFGTPEDMGRVLMEAVSTSEIEKYRKRTLFLKIAATIIGAILLIQLIYSLFFKDYTIVTNDSIIINPAVTSPTEERK